MRNEMSMNLAIPALAALMFAATASLSIAQETNLEVVDQAGEVGGGDEVLLGAPPSPEEAAFNQAVANTLPMTPEQIEEFRRLLDATQGATTSRIKPDPSPVSRSVDLSLKPGEAPPTVRMSAGNVATLTFSDLTGQPWPVLSVTTGNPSAFSVQPAGEQGTTNIVVVTPLVEVATSNLVVTLVDHPVPIILTMRSGEDEIDYRMDLRVEARGPNASYDTVDAQSLPPTGDSTMLAFLDGVPPDEARRLKTSNRDVEAFAYDDMLYVRTRLDLLSPAYLAKSSNVSDLNVYALMSAPVLIVSKEGRMTTVAIED